MHPLLHLGQGQHVGVLLVHVEQVDGVRRLVAEGLPNKEIADRLGISLHTAKTHVSVILHKLSASNRTGAVAAARELDILD